jgi:serine phosphatase RsbU (regulator of sigma subunit)
MLIELTRRASIAL